MKGKHKIIVQNNRLHYEFEIKRNITVIQGNSATGKTTLINMVRQWENLGTSSGVDVISDVPCRILEGNNWKLILENAEESIFFIDEENTFINTEEFASAVRGSGHYFVLITRENLYNLPYSVEEIYGLHTSGKYHDTKKVYQQMYHIYSSELNVPVMPEKVIVEDSNSGYDFFKNVCDEHSKVCVSAGGKLNFFSEVEKSGNKELCVVADGAAIGPEMNRLYHQVLKKKNVHLFLPESFEWIILNSGLIQEKELDDILKEPEKFIDSKQYFSWERYFTKLLVDKTTGTYLKYGKSKLNETYLHERNKQIILKSIPGIVFD